ncbi:GspE/PulE family protein [Rhodocyclus tenuis]|nr:GspE/PulE family protein [Rhodocyclus tenuis]
MEALAIPVLDENLLTRARSRSAETGERLPPALAAVSGVTPLALLAMLGQAFGYPVVTLSILRTWAPWFDAISFREAQERKLLALAAVAEGKPTLLLTDPFDAAAEDWALRRLRAAGCERSRIVLAAPEDLELYLAEQEAAIQAIDGFEAGADDLADADDGVPVITLSSIDSDEAPAVKLVNSTLYDALKLKASDIHLECESDGLQVQYRIDGVLVPVTRVTGRALAEQIVSRVKVLAELDIAERRVPQDGRFRVRVNRLDIDFRASIMPTIFGEDAVLRLLDRQALVDAAQNLRLDHLGLDAGSMARIRELAERPHGMLLVTGPTGSGKTTTLYATISEIHTGRDKIVTIEDPVEYRLSRVRQIAVNERKGLTFARGLRSLLRHDPDKIMVGEIRDEETAQIAVQAALTGHLVLTSVHANNVFDVVGRFLHMGVDPSSFAVALNGVVAQRLLRLNCLLCAEPAIPDEESLRRLGNPLPEGGWAAYRQGRGCAHCRGTGYRSRRAIAEVLCLDDRLRELIVGRAPISAFKAAAAEAGLRPMRAVAIGIAAAGETTLEEVLRVAG